MVICFSICHCFTQLTLTVRLKGYCLSFVDEKPAIWIILNIHKSCVYNGNFYAVPEQSRRDPTTRGSRRQRCCCLPFHAEAWGKCECDRCKWAYSSVLRYRRRELFDGIRQSTAWTRLPPTIRCPSVCPWSEPHGKGRQTAPVETLPLCWTNTHGRPGWNRIFFDGNASVVITVHNKQYNKGNQSAFNRSKIVIFKFMKATQWRNQSEKRSNFARHPLYFFELISTFKEC